RIEFYLTMLQRLAQIFFPDMLRFEAENFASARGIDAAPVAAEVRARLFHAGKIAAQELVGRLGEGARRRRDDERLVPVRRRFQREAACGGGVARIDVAPEAPELDAGILEALGEAAEVRLEIDAGKPQAEDRQVVNADEGIGRRLGDDFGETVRVLRPARMILVQRQIIRGERFARVEKTKR